MPTLGQQPLLKPRPRFAVAGGRFGPAAERLPEGVRRLLHRDLELTPTPARPARPAATSVSTEVEQQDVADQSLLQRDLYLTPTPLAQERETEKEIDSDLMDIVDHLNLDSDREE